MSDRSLERIPAPGRRAFVREQQVRRRRGIALVLVLVLLAGLGLALYRAADSANGPAKGSLPPSQAVALAADGELVARVGVTRAQRLGEGAGTLPVDARRTVRRGTAELTLEVDQVLLRERLGAVEGAGAVVSIPERVVASRAEVPILKQVFRNNCETAALSMLLASLGIEKDQRRLQDQIATAEPLDPQTNADGDRVWGDPNQGFVGRAPGGGPAGGFGVFEKPVLDLASRWADPVDLSGESPQAIYHSLRSGRAVMAWIGLSDGPYESWVSPQGEPITVNFGEHTVVLTGIEGDRLYLNDPLDGLRKVWTKDEFEAKWDLLDRRAISL